MANIKRLEELCDTEGGTQTIQNFRAYYEAYRKEEMTPVSYADFLKIIESYMRNSGLPGAV